MTRRHDLTPAARRDVLAGIDLFAGLAAGDLDLLAGLATELRAPRRSLVVRRDEPGDSLLVLVTGRLRAGAGSAEGREVTHSIMEPGAVLGEIALLDGQPRSLDVTAMADSRLLVLGRAAFLPFLLARPGLMLRLMEVLCARLRLRSAAFEDVAMLQVPARLARLLLTLAAEGAPTATAPLRVRTTLSQQEMGNMLGATREAVNRLMQEWRTMGVLAEAGGHLVIVRPERLRAMAA